MRSCPSGPLSHINNHFQFITSFSVEQLQIIHEISCFSGEVRMMPHIAFASLENIEFVDIARGWKGHTALCCFSLVFSHNLSVTKQTVFVSSTDHDKRCYQYSPKWHDADSKSPTLSSTVTHLRKNIWCSINFLSDKILFFFICMLKFVKHSIFCTDTLIKTALTVALWILMQSFVFLILLCPYLSIPKKTWWLFIRLKIQVLAKQGHLS